MNVYFPSLTVEGVIDRIDVGLDPKTQVSWAWMTVSHPAVIPGLVGSATIYSSEQEDRITVPQRSVYSDGLQSYVFVEEAATRATAEYQENISNLANGGWRRINQSSRASKFYKEIFILATASWYKEVMSCRVSLYSVYLN